MADTDVLWTLVSGVSAPGRPVVALAGAWFEAVVAGIDSGVGAGMRKIAAATRPTTPSTMTSSVFWLTVPLLF